MHPAAPPCSAAPEKYKPHARSAQGRRLLAAQVPKRQIARLCQVDRNTLDRYIRQVINNPDAQQNGGE